MDIETELKALVTIYAKYDEEKKSYVASPDKATLLRLDEQFNKLITMLLLVDGPEKGAIEKNRKKLSLFLHPDKIVQFIPEVAWLEQNLSEGRNDGTCFKTLTFCFEKLTTPEKYKEIKFNDIKNRDEFKTWLEGLRNEASTYTGRSLYNSLIGLLDQAGGYFDEVGRIKPKGLRFLMTFLPVILASYGAVICSEQFFAVYALYFVMLKGGQYLERNGSADLKAIGTTLQQISFITATATTTLLVRLLEMTFWASRQFYDASLQIGSAILYPLIPSSQQHPNQEYPDNLCRDLIIASKSLEEGRPFDNPELKLIAAPLESYIGLNTQQFLGPLRAGAVKSKTLESLLFSMRIIDQLPDSIGEKLEMVKSALEKVAANQKVYTRGGNTAKAIDKAIEVISFLTEDPVEMKLIGNEM